MPDLFPSSCCVELSNALGDHVYLPGTSAYNDTMMSYWSTQEALLTPACVVLPESSADVAKFMSVVARITNCSFAFKTRGHAPAAGAANINDGVTLDLSGLSTTSINGDYSIANVGAGAAWLDVYRSLNPFNKTVAGGRNGAVGVGGLTLGGGISYYSPQVGWTCDTVVNFEVVLASSEIVNANATSNTDLYRALKGGGNNFGVVTRIDFKTVGIVPLRGGRLFQSADYAPRILTAFANIASDPHYDVHTSIVTSFVFNATTRQWIALSVPVYTLPETNPPVYQELFSIPNITAQSTALIENISSLAAENPYPQKYESFFTSAYVASAELLIKLFHVANQSLHLTETPSDISWTMSFEPLPTVLTQHGASDNVLGTSPSDGNSVILLLSVSWAEVSSTAFAQDTGKALVVAMDNAASQFGGLRKFKYLNYADPSQDPLGSYGEYNLEFLRKVSAKYDRDGMFQNRVPGGFKLR
ncbi:FAD binding domain protein [Xylariaceae sp. FL0662B]|nr:FAD binding domain protein [Xylariaceae sp. FL0662B]